MCSLNYDAATNRGLDRAILSASFPAELIEDLAKTSKPSLDDGDDSWNQFIAYSNRWDQDQGHIMSMWKRVHILNAQGAERFNTMEFTFDSDSERIGVDLLEIRDAQGKLVAQGDPDQWFINDIHDTDTDMYDRRLVVPIPGVSIGSIIDIRVTWAERWADDVLPFTRQFLQPTTPTAATALVLDIPMDSKIITHHGVSERRMGDLKIYEPKTPLKLALGNASGGF